MPVTSPESWPAPRTSPRSGSPSARGASPPLWRILDGHGEGGWVKATEMDGAQLAVADYCPDWWPTATRLLIRRVRLAPAQISADSRARRRRTLHPDQRAPPISELAQPDAIYGYSYIVILWNAPTSQSTECMFGWNLSSSGRVR
jgi:hypothetical protein